MSPEAEIALIAANTALIELQECTPDEIKVIEAFLGSWIEEYDEAAKILTEIAEEA